MKILHAPTSARGEDRPRRYDLPSRLHSEVNVRGDAGQRGEGASERADLPEQSGRRLDSRGLLIPTSGADHAHPSSPGDGTGSRGTISARGNSQRTEDGGSHVSSAHTHGWRSITRRRRSRVLGVGLIMIALAAIAAVINEDPSHQRATCVLAFDVSASTLDVQQQYIEWARNIIGDCSAYRPRVYALPITSDTASTFVAPVDTVLSSHDLSLRLKREAAVDTILHRVEAMVANALVYSNGTDLLSLGPAVDDLFHDRSERLRELVVFSDGVHNSGSVDFRLVTLDDAAISDLIRNLRTEHRLPDLRGVTVRWYGAGLGGAGSPPLAPERLAEIEQFWRQYLTAAGAASVAYARTP